ncbi:MAG: antitoxin [Ruminococcus sp.]|nr:antitoxin [Ruminococcus sp.]MCD7772500.1 antitoxin [Ruminococcus sp.]
MREEYNIENLNPRRNPYAKALNEGNTITLDDDIVNYFTEMSSDKKIPYQTLINLYLTDCIKNHRQLSLSWE